MAGASQRHKHLQQVPLPLAPAGPAGVAAAVQAARQGAKVLLVERYGRLGGMAGQGLVGCGADPAADQ